MNPSNETYERIERYLLQEMTPEEVRTFEADCEADPDLAAALAQEKKVHLLIRIHNQSRIRKQIRSLDQSAAQPKVIPFMQMRRVTLLVGSIAAIFLVAIGFWWNGMGGELSGPEIADQAFANLDFEIPRSIEEMDPLKKLFIAENWPAVIVYYNQSPETFQSDPDMRLAVAYAYYKEKDFANADSLARIVMGNPGDARNYHPCKAKLLVVLTTLQFNRLPDARQLIGYTPGSKAWKEKWGCLTIEDYDQLEEMHNEIEKILP